MSEDAIRRDECPASQIILDQARWGDGAVVIDGVRLTDSQGRERAVITSGDALTVEMTYRVVRPVEELAFGVALHNAQDVLCHGTNTLIDRAELGPPSTTGGVVFKCPRLDLVQGTYFSST